MTEWIRARLCPPRDREAAARALHEARARLLEARALRVVATEHRTRLDGFVERNHFRENFERALGLHGEGDH